MFQNIIIPEEVNKFQLPNFQESKPILEKSPTQQCTEYVEHWVNQLEREFYAKIRKTPNGSPDPEFPNLIDIVSKLFVSPITLQVTCPNNPEKASFLGLNAEKTDKNPSDIYIQVLYYNPSQIRLVGFACHEDLVYYEPDRAIPKEATYRVYRESLRDIDELPEALEQKVNNKINHTVTYV